MRKTRIFSWNQGKMYGFRRFSSYKKTVVAVKLLKKTCSKSGMNGSFRTWHTKCKILNTLYTQCTAVLYVTKLYNTIVWYGCSISLM